MTVRREEGWILGVRFGAANDDGPPLDVRPCRPSRSERRGYRSGECGCGLGTPGRFRPGHDAKLRSRLMKTTAGGDNDAEDKLSEFGWR